MTPHKDKGIRRYRDMPKALPSVLKPFKFSPFSKLLLYKNRVIERIKKSGRDTINW